MCDAVNEGREIREAGDKQPERRRICGIGTIHSLVFLSPQPCRRLHPPHPFLLTIFTRISAAALMQSKATNFQIKATL